MPVVLDTPPAVIIPASKELLKRSGSLFALTDKSLLLMPLIAKRGGWDAGYQFPGAMWTDGVADYFSRDYVTAGNQKKFSIIVSFARLKFAARQDIVSFSQDIPLILLSDDTLRVSLFGVVALITTQVFRDVGHGTLLLRVDSDEAAADDRVRLYWNNKQITDFSTRNNPALSASANIWTTTKILELFKTQGGSNYAALNLSKFIYLDGESITPAQVWETDANGADRVKDLSALSFTASHSTHLDFANTASLGNDVSGNANNFTPTSITSVNASADVPSDPHAVLNTILPGAPSITNGGLSIPDGQNNMSVATLGVVSGKFAFQVKCVGGANEADVGFLLFDSDGPFKTGTAHITYRTGSAGAIDWYTVNGNIYNETSLVAAYGAPWVAGDAFQLFVDADAGDVYLAKNGSLLNSGNAVITGKTGKIWFPFGGTVSSGGDIAGMDFDFGQNGFDPGSIKTGYQEFKFANLPEPAIKNVDNGFVQVIDTEDNIEATLASAISAAGWGSSPTIWTFKDRTAAERWMMVYSDDAANELDCQATLVAKAAKRALAGTNNWVGYAERVGAAYGLYTAEISHTTGSDTTTAHGLSSTASRFEADMRSTGAGGDWWESHPDLTANYNIKRNSTAAETATQYISVDATNVVIKGAAPTATYRVTVRAEIPGFREFGKHVGNGSATDGSLSPATVSPVWAEFRRLDVAAPWANFDSARNINNQVDNNVNFNSTSAENVDAPASSHILDFLAGGVKLRGAGGAINISGGTYISTQYGSPTGGANTTPAPAR